MALSYNTARRELLLITFLFVVALIAPVVSLASQISLVTWNILAAEYARPSKYPWSNQQDLEWRIREPRIVRQLALIDADIICLQEVQVELWNGLLEKLNKHGYHGVLQSMGRGHPVANAILVRRGLSIVRTESRSRALIAVIVDEKEQTLSPLYLANVHLEAGSTQESDVQRFNQVKSLCKRLYNQISKDSHHSDCPTVVVAGDCNMLRDSALYSFLATAKDEKDNVINVPLLPLHDAYLNHPPPWGPDVHMSYRSGHLLDYVWISDAIEVLRTMPITDDATTVEPKAWPSPQHPSDHIPIGAILSWPGAPSVLSSDERTGWQQLEYVLDPWTIPTTTRRSSASEDGDIAERQ